MKNPFDMGDNEDDLTPEKTHKEYRKEFVDLSETKIDNGPGEDDFLISVALLMGDNEEYQGLLKEENFGIKEKTEKEKIVSDADNIFSIKHFMRDNLKEIKRDRNLQKEIKSRITKLKKLRQSQEGSQAEEAILITLEAFIDGMLDDDIEE